VSKQVLEASKQARISALVQYLWDVGYETLEDQIAFVGGAREHLPLIRRMGDGWEESFQRSYELKDKERQLEAENDGEQEEG
jgi:hypothetical protein